MSIRPRPWAVLFCATLGLAPLAAHAEAPLSAIDWLSSSVATPAAKPALKEPGVTGVGSAMPQRVIVSRLDGPSPDAAGVLASRVTGLPRNLWGLGETEQIAALISTRRDDALPSLQRVMMTLMLAQANAPADADGRGILLMARIDKLLDMGALDEANALIAATGKMTPQVFRRYFDISMLTGHEDDACAHLHKSPDLAPTYPARIFCLARSGDWTGAALTLRMAQALGYVEASDDALLSRFLDPDLYEGEPPLTPPAPVTPLAWRMLEAIGESLPTIHLPIAFAHAELREAAGWKAKLDAAERLGRASVLSPNRLIGIYSERLPAASGGVWDRVEAVQRFDTALKAADPGAVALALPNAWEMMVEAGLEAPFAELFAERLMRLPLMDDAKTLAFEIALLSSQYEAAALEYTPANTQEAFLIGIARGSLQGVTPPDNLSRAIAPAFLRAAPPADLLALLEEQRLGEAILHAVDRIERGLHGDLRGVTEGLALFRHVGLEDLARRTALELILLERRG
ncbi:hypothetical protein EOK75_03035 [Pseudorhodobacter turbinis]|uniref:Uncharacterized protein n=1 Tax=Pseudorhodobacter turbinis TaxID=2500533 RepID=A0A4P8ED77_9RHOB|nr:hypothetical protein [Pseudorhodobacter turbinis]QCO54851.1 hypothetical protein EOK75_03035 [Pseudorhodobacter turbinis]